MCPECLRHKTVWALMDILFWSTKVETERTWILLCAKAWNFCARIRARGVEHKALLCGAERMLPHGILRSFFIPDGMLHA